MEEKSRGVEHTEGGDGARNSIVGASPARRHACPRALTYSSSNDDDVMSGRDSVAYDFCTTAHPQVRRPPLSPSKFQ